MKWFKLDSDFIFDDKIAKILKGDKKNLGPESAFCWVALLAFISKQYDGNPEKEFKIFLPTMANALNITERVLNRRLTAIQQSFNGHSTAIQRPFNMRLTVNERLLTGTYPKFLKKHKMPPRDGFGKFNQNRIDKNRIDKNKNKEIIKKPTSFYFAEAKRVIDFLNKEAGRNFGYNKTTMKFVEARLRELTDDRNCSMEEAGDLMRQVVSLKKMNAFFVEGGFLRPSTLYNKTKFNEYLEEVETYEKNRRSGSKKT